MTRIINIARWEWFKLQRKRMPWILLAILFACTQLAVWGPYIAYQSTVASGGAVFAPFQNNAGPPRMVQCKELLADPSKIVPAGTPQQATDALLQQCRQQKERLVGRSQLFSPTGGVSSALGFASSLGLILLGILSASVVGVEYGVGTLRPILTRGTGRLSYLAGKYLMLIAATTCALLLICATAAGSGLLTGQGMPPPLEGAASGSSFATVAIAFLKTWAAMVTYVTMAGSITLLLRSTAAGMALSLAYYIAEGILIRLLSAAFSGFDKVADYLPMRNISALTSSRVNLAATLGRTSDIGTLHASLVLTAYVILFAGVAAYVFRRRDVVGASGG